MTTSAPSTTRRGSWLRRLAWLFAIAAALLIATYFVITSGAFFKGVILPKVSQSMNATVRVHDAAISPFSAVTLKGLEVRTGSPDPVFSADEVRLRYSLMAMLGGNLQVDEVALVNPQIRVVQNADGTSNLDAITQHPPAQTPASAPPDSGAVPNVAIAKIALVNGALHFQQKATNGAETRLDLDKLNFSLTDLRNGQTARLTFDGHGTWSAGPAASNTMAEATLKSDLSLGLSPSLNLVFAKGQAETAINAATGAAAQLAGFRSTLAIDVTPTEFKQVLWQAFQGARPLASASLKGTFDLSKKEGSLDFTLAPLHLADWQGFAPDLQAVGTLAAQAQMSARDGGRAITFSAQSTLRDLGAHLGSNTVSQLGAELAVHGQLNQDGPRQSASGLLTLTNLSGRVSGLDLKAIALGLEYDLAATDGKKIELKKCALHLAETARAKVNQLTVSGRVDASQPDALDGSLLLAADTLDLTPYYDLFAGSPASGPAPPSAPASTNAPAEPEPLQLPVKQVTVNAQIGQLWLRELEAARVQTTVLAERSRVLIRPFSLAMNGAPLTADVDLDLSVRGWRYAVRAKADGLPIAPLANSFAPDYRGRAKGELWSDLKVDGAGVTGPSLRKNLLGNIGLTFTNADIQIVGPRLKGFLTPIAMALNAPGLLNSPLNWVGFGASLGSGKIGLSQLALVSPSFAAATHGEVALGDSLRETRLGNWPMAFQLERSLAERLKLAPKDTPTNVPLVAMPQFVTVAGTANEPTPKIDLKSLAGAALLKYADRIPGLDERTSGLLKGAAGLLSGTSSGSNTNAAATSTNAPATNSPVGDLLNILKRPRQK